MDDITLTISLHKKNLKIVPSAPMHFDDMVTILVNTIKALAMQMIKAAPANTTKAVRGMVFDFLNLAFSRTLEDIDPTCVTQTSLTAKAIREAEDKIIREGRLDDVVPGS